MLPFPIMNTYGNELPKSTVKKLLAPEPTSYYGTFMVLYDTGQLYAIGGGTSNNAIHGNGNGTTNFTSWNLVLSNIKDVWASTTQSILVRANDDKFYYCGNPGFLGGASTTYVYTYTECTSFFTSVLSTAQIANIVDIFMSFNSIFVLLSTGELYRCGNSNPAGVLGTGGTTTLTALTLLTTNVKKVAMKGVSLWLLKNDSTLWRCGQNVSGNLATGNTTNLYALTQYNPGSSFTALDIEISTNSTFMVLQSSGTNSVYSCGSSFSGNIANGSTTNTQVTSIVNTTMTLGSTWTLYGMLGQDSNGILIKTNSALYGTGNNTTGRIGTADTANKTRFTASTTATNFSSSSLVCGSKIGSAYINSSNELYYSGSTPTGTIVGSSFRKLNLPL